MKKKCTDEQLHRNEMRKKKRTDEQRQKQTGRGAPSLAEADCPIYDSGKLLTGVVRSHHSA